MGYADADGMETVDEYICDENCPVKKLGEQSGERLSGYRENPSTNLTTWFGSKDGTHIEGVRGHNDTGTAARFYPNPDWSYEVAEQLAAADPVRYVAKAGRKERDAGLDGMPESRNDWDRESSGLSKGWPERLGEAETQHQPKRNAHPTIKPIALTRWLATLLLPPAEYAPRRILIPFCGVMSEAIGAMLAGFEEIVAVEMSSEYCEIGEARMQWWINRMQETGLDEPGAILKSKKNGRLLL